MTRCCHLLLAPTLPFPSSIAALFALPAQPADLHASCPTAQRNQSKMFMPLHYEKEESFTHYSRHSRALLRYVYSGAYFALS
ncbi:hypothetical protein E2C01_052878 [Portunus trituberculatus]|uniref:Secreted protein n=1 Tax=Portunus trituberculatus TaxID=210409 RepID=A0A5B7GPD5_PORTR|nr:hypothetical protein [Portunus trituberculatus]